MREAFTSKQQQIGAAPGCLKSEPCPWQKSLSRADNGRASADLAEARSAVANIADVMKKATSLIT
jgi:hypothetical protein